MGNFVHHNAGGVIAAGGISFVTFTYFQTDIVNSLVTGVICYISSLLPDIDSPASKPSDFVANIVSILATSFCVIKLVQTSDNYSEIILVSFSAFVLTNVVIRQVLRRIMIHRGVLHSIPASIIWGCLIFLLFSKETEIIKNLLAVSAVIGYCIHLIIDEMFSAINLNGVTLDTKKSFGTALKLNGNTSLSTVFIYCLLIYMLWLCFL